MVRKTDSGGNLLQLHVPAEGPLSPACSGAACDRTAHGRVVWGSSWCFAWGFEYKWKESILLCSSLENCVEAWHRWRWMVQCLFLPVLGLLVAKARTSACDGAVYCLGGGGISQEGEYSRKSRQTITKGIWSGWLYLALKIIFSIPWNNSRSKVPSGD